MTPSARAKDRAVKYGGGKPSDYSYNKSKNSTKRKEINGKTKSR
jgi:hypothetical protein